MHPEVEFIHGILPAPPMDYRFQILDTGHAVSEEGAGGVDMGDVVGVAEAAAAALVLGWVDASGRDGIRFLPPVLPHRLLSPPISS